MWLQQCDAISKPQAPFLCPTSRIKENWIKQKKTAGKIFVGNMYVLLMKELECSGLKLPAAQATYAERTEQSQRPYSSQLWA